MSTLFMTDWPMFGSTHASLGANRDLLFGDPFGALGLFLVRSGVLQGATFERSGDVLALINAIPVVFGPNEPVIVDARLIQHGAVTETTPAYAISPLVRPTAPDVYDTAASAPDPDKHGVNWESTNPKNGWAFNLLGGVPGADLWDDATAIVQGGIQSPAGVYTTSPPPRIDVYNEDILTFGDVYRVTFSVDGYTAGLCGISGNTTIGGYYVTADGTYTALITHNGGIPGELRFVCTAGTIQFSMLSARPMLPAIGTLTLKPLNIAPDKTQWQTVGDFNILSGDDGLTVSQILYVEQTTGLICAKDDAANVCKSATEYVEGTDPQVDLIFNGTQMAIVLDGVQGTASAFSGHFPVGVTIKLGFENEDIWSSGDIYGQPGTPVIL